MMKLSEIIKKNHIISELKAKDKKSVLDELAEVVSQNDPCIDKSLLVRVLLEREQLGSTGNRRRCSHPAWKAPGRDETGCFLREKRQGAGFDSMDGQLAYLFFLLLAPENSSGIHLQVLTRIARILKSSAFRKELMGAETQEDLYRIIMQSDEDFEH